MIINRVLDASSGMVLFLWLVPPDRGQAALFDKMGMIIFGFILLFFHFQGIYRSFRFSTLRYEIRTIFSACFFVLTVLFLMVYVLGLFEILPRGRLVIWGGSWPLFIALTRLALRTFLRFIRVRGLNLKQAVIVGQSRAGMELAQHIKTNAWSGTRVLGFFSEGNGDSIECATCHDIDGVPCLGHINELAHFVQNHDVDMIYVALNGNNEATTLRMVKTIESLPTEIFFVPNVLFLDLVISGEVIFFENNPVIALRDTPIRGLAGAAKRGMDVILALTGLIAMIPVFITVGLLIRMTSPGPVFFLQKRYGMHGEQMVIYKFRTMVHNCETAGVSYVQATKNDARVTPVGAFLRKTSLDELPQLINVIQGRMSLVGPRPHPVSMDEQYRKIISGYMTRQRVKPGITGLAQVKGFRGETETLEKMEKRIEYDLRYIREWSLLLDVEILIRTLAVMLFQKNAY